MSGEVAARLKTPIAELGLSVRVMNCLKRRDIKDVEELFKTSMKDLAKIRGFGKNCTKELLEKTTAFHINKRVGVDFCE